LGHHPDLVQVEAEVFVDQNISQRDDLRPLDLGVTVSDRLGDATGSLSNDLQVMDNPNLEHLVVLKGQAIRHPLFDLGDCRQNIVQSIHVAPHRAIASR
jgi:hypothetical protein